MKIARRGCFATLGAISLSVGIAIFPDNASDAEGIVKAADVALYRAKQAGRNRVAMFTDAKPAYIEQPV